MSGYGQPREGGGNMRRLGGECWWKITSTQGKGKRNMIQVCQVLHPSDFTVCSIVGDIMLVVQCTGHEGKMKIYYEW